MNYKVLIVDDEEIIRRGLKNVVPWNDLGFSTPDLACTGKEALQLIDKESYRLLITDIQMPEMDGLELIENWRARKKNTYFVILSGHEEFDYAREAIKMGVHHFLIKPTDMQEIRKVLETVYEEIKKTESRESLFEELKRRVRDNASLVENQFLSDLLRGREYDKDELNEFRETLQWEDEEFRLLLLIPDYPETYPGFLTLNILRDRIFNEKSIISSTIIHNSEVLLVRESDDLMLVDKLNQLLSDFSHQQKGQLTAIIGGKGHLKDLHRIYSDARRLSEFRFYTSIGEIISEEEYSHINSQVPLFKTDPVTIDKLLTLARAGRSDEFKSLLEDFLSRMRAEGYHKESIQAEIVNLLLKLSGDGTNELANKISSLIVQISGLERIEKLIEFVVEALDPLMEINRNSLLSHRGILAQRIADIVKENLTDHVLSLRWIANNKLFASEDYLGKVFKSEMKLNFTQFVNRMRVDSAKELINRFPNLQLSEIAEKSGFQDNPQYFYRVFKKIEGMTPGEFKKSI